MSLLARLQGVGQSFGSLTVLSGVDLALERGCYATIAGPSGSGKSTLLHVLALLEPPTTGTYELDGRDVSRLTDAERSRLRQQRVGLVFQRFHLLGRRTVLENVLLPLRYRDGTGDVARMRERAVDLLRGFGLGERMLARCATLSGGEQQRVAIARALLLDPQLVLADEPTGNLDRASGRQAVAALESCVGDGRGLVVVTHDRELARRGTSRFSIDGGTLRPVAG